MVQRTIEGWKSDRAAVIREWFPENPAPGFSRALQQKNRHEGILLIRRDSLPGFTDSADRALRVCGTGTLCHSAQLRTFGRRVIGLELARPLAGQSLACTFEGTSASAAKLTLTKDDEGATSC